MCILWKGIDGNAEKCYKSIVEQRKEQKMLSLDADFESVTATAILTSYPRTFTDIPYEKEIFSKLQENKF